MCRVYGVSPRSYYSWLERGKSLRAVEDQLLLKRIVHEFDKSEQIYGSPKIYKELKKQGIAVSEKRVARLMRENGLKAKKSRIYRSRPGTQRFYTGIPNIIWNQEVTAANQVWVGDITYLKVNEEWRYLAVVLDLFSRKVIGWAFGKRKSVSLTTKALRRAVKRRGLHPGLIFHSDRGIEYGAFEYRELLDTYGIRQSMNRVGVMNDNVYIESFFHQFKTERIKTKEFSSDWTLRRTIQLYMKWYNEIRSHSSIGYLSPVEYECSI